MNKHIGILITLIWIPQIGQAQTTIDSLQINQLAKIELITEIYSIPHARYKLDHFVFVHKTAHIDPEVQYNKGEGITGESKLLLNRVKPGDTLIVKEVYAVNLESPESGLIKLPERKFLLK